MSDRQDERAPEGSRSLGDHEIKTDRVRGRRSFLRNIGVGLFGAAAVVVGRSTPAYAKDFPKKSNDSDTTSNRDLKTADSDSHNSKAVDSDQSRLRDAKGSSDTD